jgi:hypothetical protein
MPSVSTCVFVTTRSPSSAAARCGAGKAAQRNTLPVDTSWRNAAGVRWPGQWLKFGPSGAMPSTEITGVDSRVGSKKRNCMPRIV